MASADLRFAAWFLWMTPLLTALSSLRDARLQRLGGGVGVAGVDGLAERCGSCVFSSLLTALLRW